MNSFDIEKFLSLNNYVTEERKKRRTGIKSTQEFFTPYLVIKQMCNEITEEDWVDPKKTFLEPSFGSGQFIIYIIWNRIQHNIPWQTALETCFGVELMTDNVEECKQRVCKMLSQICEDFDEALARSIMNKNFVCANFFEWDFKEWRPMTEEETKKAKKR